MVPFWLLHTKGKTELLCFSAPSCTARASWDYLACNQTVGLVFLSVPSLHFQCSVLGNNLKDLVDKYQHYEDASCGLLSGLQVCEAKASKHLCEPIAVDPKNLQRQLEESKVKRRGKRDSPPVVLWMPSVLCACVIISLWAKKTRAKCSVPPEGVLTRLSSPWLLSHCYWTHLTLLLLPAFYHTHLLPQHHPPTYLLLYFLIFLPFPLELSSVKAGVCVCVVHCRSPSI